MDDTLAVAIAEERAEDVTREVVPPLVASEVETRLPGVVDALVTPLLDETVPAMVGERVEAAYKASPPAPGRDGIDGANGVDGTNGTNGTNGQDGQDGEKGLNWRGPYRKGTTYLPDDAVEAEGSSFVATNRTRSKPPSPDWDLLARKGEPGAPGSHSGAHGGGGVTVQDEGVDLGSVTTQNFVGTGVTVTKSGSVATVTVSGGGGGSSLTIKDEGVVLDTAVSSIDIVGAGATATNVGHAVTLTVPGASTPTLAAVLVAGNDPGGHTIHGADDAPTTGGTLTVAAGDHTGDAAGGTVILLAGDNTAFGTGSRIQAFGGSADAGGGGEFELLGGIGTAGNNGGNVLLQAGAGNANGSSGAALTLIGGDGTTVEGTADIIARQLTLNGNVLNGVYVQPSDPGAVGAGALWVDTTTPGTSDQHVWKRTAADSGWADLLGLYQGSEALSITGPVDPGGNAGGGMNLGAGSGLIGGVASFSGGTNATSGQQPGSVHAFGGNDDDNKGGDIQVTGGAAGPGTGGRGGNAFLTPGAGDGAGAAGKLEITDSAQSTGTAGQLLTAQGDTTALWGLISAAITASGDAAAIRTALGVSTWTETEVDFGTTPVWSKTFTVTAAGCTAASKVACVPSGNVATGRTGNDLEWDNLLLGALPNTGTFTLTALAMPGPIVGPRKVFYQVT